MKLVCHTKFIILEKFHPKIFTLLVPSVKESHLAEKYSVEGGPSAELQIIEVYPGNFDSCFCTLGR
jgi:hypothetical protein